MTILKLPICILKKHKLEGESLINAINHDNYLKKCSRCGLYVAHSYLSDFSITVTEKNAMKLKREFEREFPYSVKAGEKE